MIPRWTLLICCLVFLSSSAARPAAASDDPFPFGKKFGSRNFSITLALGVDEHALVRRLHITPPLKVLAGEAIQGGNYSFDDLGDMLDILFSWVGTTLDMPLYSHTIEIKVLAGVGQLNAVARKLYGHDARSDKAFYCPEKRTIYVVAPAFTREVVGHEIAHATICCFMAIPLSEKLQEVLAGYVEYQLRKVPVGI